MDRTARGGEAASGSIFEGWNIGAVSVKRVRLHEDGTVEADIRRHAGDPASMIRCMLDHGGEVPDGAVVTGSQSVSFLSLPYLPESICLEAALHNLGTRPDLVLSLGGETFVVYCIANGVVRRMIASNRCAAGSGEFLVQQFARMNLDLTSGIAAARQGRRVTLASRCSVHCKSDATHRLNKGECAPGDIACSLLASLAAKIAALILATGWSHNQILLAGGLARSAQLVDEISSLLPGTRVEVLPQSGYLEALGAAVMAREQGEQPLPCVASWVKPADAARFRKRRPLSPFCDRVIRMQDQGSIPPQPGMHFILGVDAGSTTTKAILLDRASGRIAARCYLRTHGNPVQATFECIADLERQIGGIPHRVVQAAVTGSGREIVSVYLDNCAVFNEILAHARAARALVPDVDTLFEIGGQDAKFVALQAGIPVDYSMNDGCSAGTGSFLEEAASSDMQVPVEQLGPLALGSTAPIAFGERCAAFINSEVRSALQQGVPHADVLAGLVYAIVENYLSRVVGARQIGGWYDAAPIIFERLGEANAVVAWPTAKNNFLGKGDRLGALKVAAYVLSDVLQEMRSTLRCLAKDRRAALALLDESERRLVAVSQSGLLTTERELRRAVKRLASVPLRAPLERSARLLLFGGVNRIFLDGPVKDFFEERGILTKTTEMSEFMCFLQAEDIVRLGFSHGYLAPGDQCSMSVLLSELLTDHDRTAARRALAARVRIGFIELLDQRWRRIASESGLLFSPYVRFADVEREGHKRISLNGYTEAPMTIGRYAALLRSGAFDGYVNIGAFNCAPANTASAVIHALSLRTDTPYAVIESDGDCMTSGQLRQLETVAVQCRRRREDLDGRPAA